MWRDGRVRRQAPEGSWRRTQAEKFARRPNAEASALRELLSETVGGRRQARSRLASASRHGPVAALGLFLHRCRSQDGPLPVLPPSRDRTARPTTGPRNERRRIGYRRLFILLRREGEPSGVNRMYRLYRKEGLTVCKRRARRRAVGTRTRRSWSRRDRMHAGRWTSCMTSSPAGGASGCSTSLTT